MYELYGNYRNRTFCEIWGSYEEFNADYRQSKLDILDDEHLETLYYLLYSRYGNSVIASFDENQFKYKVYTTIYQYGPTWAKRVDTQKSIRELSLDELRTGSKAIYNTAQNPSATPTTQSMEELQYINAQNTTNYKKSTIEAYGTLLSLLETDVTGEFIDKFKKLFLSIVQPEIPLWYITKENNDD